MRIRARIQKKYRKTLGKLASIFKVIISQDQGSIGTLLEVILGLNPQLVSLIFKKWKYFMALLSTEIDNKDLSRF
jgi:hypothetical protein